jgi:hypothetical protein
MSASGCLTDEKTTHAVDKGPDDEIDHYFHYSLHVECLRDEQVHG